MASLRTLFDLEGRVAVVTGGSRGLGLQIAEALGEFGAKIVLVARKAATLAEAQAHLRSQAIEADVVAADLSKPEAIAALVAEIVERHGRIDILVNNAGATWGAAAEVHPLDGWSKVIDLNLTAQFLLSQAIGRDCFLPQGKGVILNLASVEGLGGHHPDLPGTIAYNTAKGGVVNFTRALAAEWGRKGVRVNAIAPGHFPSKMTDVILQQHGERIVDLIPLGKLGGPDDLKGAALLLVSDAGTHITGQILAVDGGASAI